MNKKTIGYWIPTALIAFALLGGGFGQLSGSPEVTAGLTSLGYPAYFAKILGTWKLLGALALLAPGFPRLKEWAYAGVVFSMTGAAASHAFAGDPAGKVITPLVLAGIAVASWALRPDSRKLASAPNTATDTVLVAAKAIST